MFNLKKSRYAYNLRKGEMITFEKSGITSAGRVVINYREVRELLIKLLGSNEFLNVRYKEVKV